MHRDTIVIQKVIVRRIQCMTILLVTRLPNRSSRVTSTSEAVPTFNWTLRFSGSTSAAAGYGFRSTVTLKLNCGVSDSSTCQVTWDDVAEVIVK